MIFEDYVKQECGDLDKYDIEVFADWIGAEKPEGWRTSCNRPLAYWQDLRNEYFDDEEEDDEDSFKVEFEDRMAHTHTIEVYKSDGKWHERLIDTDDDDEEGARFYFNARTYMGYLTKSDILTWIRGDYDNVRLVESVEENTQNKITETPQKKLPKNLDLDNLYVVMSDSDEYYNHTTGELTGYLTVECVYDNEKDAQTDLEACEEFASDYDEDIDYKVMPIDISDIEDGLYVVKSNDGGYYNHEYGDLSFTLTKECVYLNKEDAEQDKKACEEFASDYSEDITYTVEKVNTWKIE